MTIDFYIISDIHGNHDDIDILFEKGKVEHIFILGDITSFGSLDEALDTLEKLNKVIKTSGYFIPGNCDPDQLFNVDRVGNIFNVHNISRPLSNTKLCVYGIGGYRITSPRIHEEIREKYCSNYIFISHIPPYDTKIGKYMGSEEIRKWIKEIKPIASFSGHIHEARGIDYLNGSLLVNPGPFEEGYYAYGLIKGMEVNIELLKLF